MAFHREEARYTKLEEGNGVIRVVSFLLDILNILCTDIGERNFSILKVSIKVEQGTQHHMPSMGVKFAFLWHLVCIAIEQSSHSKRLSPIFRNLLHASQISLN